MNLEEQCSLSYYVQVAGINEEHEVFLVQHAESNKFFVKKTLHYYNLEILSSLKSSPIPNMPRIYELFEEPGSLHIIEEYLSGSTLEEIISEGGPLSEETTTSYVLQLCDIVKSLHTRKPPIIHRDIKPSNIIITPDGIVKLLDLSAAKISDVSKNQDTVMMGTAGYAAPEQYGFSISSTLTDIYAIGVLMNRMLTGEMLQVMKYDGRLSHVINKCTRLDPSERYKNIDDLTHALRKTSAPVSMPTVPAADTIRKYLPPGFRSGKLLPSILALAGYICLFSITFSLDVKNPTPSSTVINRIGATLAVLAVILFSGNYLSCQQLLPLSKSENRIVRILGIILWDVVIFVLIVLIVAALQV